MESSYYFELYGKEKVEQGRMEIIQNLLESGLSAEQVSKLAKVPLNRVQRKKENKVVLKWLTNLFEIY